MGWFWRWYERVRSIFRRGRVEGELREEMRFHLDMEIRDRMARGMSPAEARRTAHRDFGGVERHAEEVRSVRWTHALEHLLRDVRYGARALVARPMFTMVVLLTLALGVGAATTVFSVVDGVLLRPLPYPESERLVRIHTVWRGTSSGRLSPAEAVDLERALSEFEAVGVYGYGGATLTGAGGAMRVSASYASAGALAALGVAPARGRPYTSREDHGNAAVALLMDGFWRSRFGADPSVVGRTIELSGEAVEVIGVMPADFRMPEDLASSDPTQVIRPLALDPAQVDMSERGSHFLRGVARVPERLSSAEAVRRVEGVAAEMVRTYPNGYPPEMEFRLAVLPLLEDVVGPVEPMLLLLLAAVGFVFVIVCANVANLLLSRTEGRARELAVRKAVGASRGRILAQVLVESLLLAGVGGALGVGLAFAGTRLFRGAAPPDLPRLESVGMDLRVVGFGLVLSVLAGVLFGLAPALRAGGGPTAALRDGPGSGLGPSRQRLKRWMVAVQVAIAVVLATGAGLMTRSFISLSRVDPGYRTEQVATARVSLPSASYPSADEVVAFHAELVDRIAALPGVSGAGAVTNLPLATELGDLGFELEEDRIPEGRDKPDADWQVVTPGYFDAMAMRLARGRGIEPTDRAGAPGVVVVNRTMGEAFWPGMDPLGRRIRLGGQRTAPRWAQVVGIVEDVRHGGLDETDGRPQMYLAHQQFRTWSDASAIRTMTLVAHTTVPPAELYRGFRETVAALDPALPVFSFRVMEDVVRGAVARPRLLTALLSGFSGVALLLALVGVYGVVGYAVGQRRREFGIRIALGAAPRTVSRLVLRDAVRIAAPGVIAGLAAAILGGALLESFLYELSPTDPLTLALTTLVVAGTAILASAIPAHRAMRLDPARVLKAE